MNEKTTVFSTFYNSIEANIIKSRLEDSGFSCFLADENVASLSYNQAVGGVKLIVFERDVEEITTLLKEETVVDIEAGALIEPTRKENVKVLCKHCGSVNVGYGLATKKKHSWWGVVLSLLSASYPAKENKCYHCYDCYQEFQ